MSEIQTDVAEGARLSGDTPTMRLFALLEVMAGRDRRSTLQDLVELTGLPKPTVHRMLQQLEGSGLLLRESDGRHYGIGSRLRRLAENLLLHDAKHGARHAVLRHLVDELGETCNLTALSGTDVLYLEKLYGHNPVRSPSHVGGRIPATCCALGKAMLAFSEPEVVQAAIVEGLKPRTPYTIANVPHFLAAMLTRCL